MNALKKLVKGYYSVSLIVRILIGLILGALLGLFLPGMTWVSVLGSVFVGALKAIAPVLVFVLVISALAQGSGKLDRRFGLVIGLYMLTTFLASMIAVFASFLFPVTLKLSEAASAEVIPSGVGK